MVALGWTNATIGLLIDSKQASIQTGPFGTVLSASEYIDHGVPVVSVREIRQGRIEIFPETPTVSTLTFQKLPQFNLMPFDLVFARKGSVDRSALIPEDSQKLFLGSDGIRLRFTNPTLAQIVFRCVQSTQTRQFLTISSYGTTMAGVNEAIISSIPICIPKDSKEQERIAVALSDMDELISSLEKLIAKKKTIKQGAMEQLLTGKTRLPGFSGEWENVLVRDLGCIVGGGTPSTKKATWWSGRIPWISSSDLDENNITKVKLSRFITPEAVSSSATCICPVNTVLIVSRVGVGKVAIAPCDLCTSQDFSNLILYDSSPKYIAYALSQKMQSMASRVQGTSIKGLTSENIGAIEMTMPKKAEQEAMVAILSDMDNEIDTLETRLTKSRQIKQGMMQQLLTGRIRLIMQERES